MSTRKMDCSITSRRKPTLAGPRRHPYLGRVYLDWAVFPYVQERKLEGNSGYLVAFQDLRYTYPSLSRQAPLGGFVWLNPKLQWFRKG